MWSGTSSSTHEVTGSPARARNARSFSGPSQPQPTLPVGSASGRHRMWSLHSRSAQTAVNSPAVGRTGPSHSGTRTQVSRYGRSAATRRQSPHQPDSLSRPTVPTLPAQAMTARLWDPRTGVQQALLTAHQGRINGVTFSADGTRVATGGEDGRVILWEAQNGTSIRVYTGHVNAVIGLGLAARPGEPRAAQLLAASQGRNIRIWDTESPVTERLLQGHAADVSDIAIQGGKLYSAALDGTIRGWSLTLPYRRLLDLPSEPRSTAVAPDGSSVAVGFSDGSLSSTLLP